uniref:VOC family protein n=1 Tax=Streptomyces chartreusis TaxID=1969 RepID=UPI003F490FB2
MTDLESINHLGVIVADIDRVIDPYTQLGFAFTPLSRHRGALRPGEPVADLGTGNRCAVFRSTYLEVVTIIPGSAAAQVPPGLPDGLHILCFGSPDAAALAHRWTAAGIPNDGAVPLERNVDTPQGPDLVKAIRVMIDFAATSEGQLLASELLTPQTVHQPRYMSHDNGALELSELVVSASDAAAVARRYAVMTGIHAERDGDAHVIRLPGQQLVFLAPGDVERYVPGARPSESPAMVAFGVAVHNLNATRTLLHDRDIAHKDALGRLVVPPPYGPGPAVVFESERVT